MGIMSRIMQPQALSVTNEKAWNPSLWAFMGAQSTSGANVNEYTAFTYSAFYNAVALISGTIGALPLHLYRREEKRNILADNESLYRVMHDRWNDYMTAMTGRETMTAHILSWGNGYAEKVKNNRGDIIALWPIPPHRVRMEMVDEVLTYKVRVDNVEVPMTREQILHVPGLGFDGFQGYSVVAMARQSIGLGMAMEEFGSRFFGNGTHPGAIVSHPGKLSEQAHTNLKNDLTTKYSGLGQSHRLLLLEEGMELKNLGIPPEDAQFLESRQHQIPEIARWFNLPPHKLKDLTRSSFNNIESEQISFLTDSILPWLVRFEQHYNMQLLSATERNTEKLYFKHVVEGILRSSSADRAAFYNRMFMTGGMTINEIRGKEEFDPSDEEFADDLFVPRNMIPISMIREMLEKEKAAPAKPPGENENEEPQPQPVPNKGA